MQWRSALLLTVASADCDLRRGQDCQGSDISSSSASSAEACCSLCSSTAGCAAFTWAQYDGQGQPNPTCYLKSDCSNAVDCDTCTAGTSGATPSPPPGPPSPAPQSELYCPGAESFQFDGGASWTGNGWTIQGGGGAHGLTSFNMLGGYMEFDLDNSGSQWGVNNNFYTISPDHPYTSYDDYCDGQGPDASSPKGVYCMELDIWEGNGNQNGATTLHNWFNHDGGCDQGGCAAEYSGGGNMHFHVTWDESGVMHTSINGQENGDFNPYPSQDAIDNTRDTMSRVGVVFVSSQWTGWVPGAGSVTGDLDHSQFSVSNLRVGGQVVMGPEPAKCGSELAI